MQISEIFSSENNFVDSKITIEGVFVMNCGVGYFVKNTDGIGDKEESIFIEHEDLENKLLSSVPAFGGGEISYCDKAKISGFLIYKPSNGFLFSLTKISDFTIYKYDEEFNVKL
ncbi:MAG: hypothetical protein V4447_05770 [Pseudomonadota bacterium]